MGNKIELKVGDQFYCINRGNVIRGLVTIERLTKTQAISKSVKFKRYQYDTGYMQSIGCGSYNTTFYYKKTLKLDNQYKKQKLVYKLSNMDWDKYDLEKLYDINTFL